MVVKWKTIIYHTRIKNVGIKFSAHDAFLEQPSSGDAQNGKPNNLKPKGLIQDNQNRPRSSMPEGGEP